MTSSVVPEPFDRVEVVIRWATSMGLDTNASVLRRAIRWRSLPPLHLPLRPLGAISAALRDAQRRGAPPGAIEEVASWARRVAAAADGVDRQPHSRDENPSGGSSSQVVGRRILHRLAR